MKYQLLFCLLLFQRAIPWSSIADIHANQEFSFAKAAVAISDPKPEQKVIDFQAIIGPGDFLLNLEKCRKVLSRISNSFKICLLQFGVNEKAFKNCVGKKYSKVTTSFNKEMLGFQTEVIELFKNEIQPICDKKLTQLCDSLLISLNYLVIMNEAPLLSLQRILNGSNASAGDKMEFVLPLKHLQENYKRLQGLRIEAQNSQFKAVQQIIEFIDKLKPKADFSYQPNPFSPYTPPQAKTKARTKAKPEILVKELDSVPGNSKDGNPIEIVAEKKKKVVIRNPFAVSLLAMSKLQKSLYYQNAMGLKGKKSLGELQSELMQKGLVELAKNKNEIPAKLILV